MRKSLLTLFFCFVLSFSFGQSEVTIKGVILAVEDDKVYLDLNENNISIGDRLQVIEDRGFFTHPVTGEQIAREPEVVAYIQITDVMSNYSIGTISPRSAISKLAEGMEAFLLEGEARDSREFRKSIAVQPMNVSSARGGYLGFYIADLLTEELFNIDKFRVIDRQTLGLQMDEIAMTSQGVIDEREAIQLGRTRGVNYFITGTVYEPDVVETGTGVPVKGIMQAAEAISGQRLGSEFASDVRVSQLRAIVHITLRVVDVETGEIIFIASEMQQAQGRSQINLEQGALGGLQLQGGATSFLNTITGQATKAALVNLAGYIDDYFEGKIDVRNFRGNVIDIGSIGSRSERVEMNNANMNLINKSASDWLGRQTIMVTLDKGAKTGFRNNFSYPVYMEIYEESAITGEANPIGVRRVGRVKINLLEKNSSRGLLTLRKDTEKDYENLIANSYIEYINFRRLSFNFLLGGGSSQIFDPVEGPRVEIEYLFNPNISAGAVYYIDSRSLSFRPRLGSTREDLRELSLALYLAPNIRFNKTFNFSTKIGGVFYEFLYQEEATASSYGFMFEPSIRIFAANWLSLNINIPISPYFGLGYGLGFHIL